MRYPVTACLLMMAMASIATAKTTLDTIEKYSSTMRNSQLFINMLIKYILIPSYGAHREFVSIEDIDGVENVASASNENIADAIQKIFVAVTDRNSFGDHQHVNTRIQALLVEPCMELEQRLGKLIDSLDGSAQEHQNWIAKRAICRRIVSQTQDIQLAVCLRVGC